MTDRSQGKAEPEDRPLSTDERWELCKKQNPELERLEREWIAFGTKESKGEASVQDLLLHLKSFPPEWRARLAQHPEGEIFRPETYDPMVAALEQLVELSRYAAGRCGHPLVSGWR